MKGVLLCAIFICEYSFANKNLGNWVSLQNW